MRTAVAEGIGGLLRLKNDDRPAVVRRDHRREEPPHHRLRHALGHIRSQVRPALAVR